MQFVSVTAAVLSIVGGITIVICVGLWPLFCRWVIKSAVKRGEKTDTVEVIRASSLGMIGRSSKAPALPSPPKSDDTLLAA